jgi:monofunctional glycosyltransferase
MTNGRWGRLRPKGWWARNQSRLGLALLGVVVGLPLALTLLFRAVPPPVTPLMVTRVRPGAVRRQSGIPALFR